jgi:colanic acid biosynthesis glycosyl transferase WcaI
MRVVLLTQWFDPEPTFKGLTFARELVRQGFEVEVVTGFPNYPGGKIYSGYRISLIQREEIDGVRITRLPLYPSHDGSAFGRIANYISFAASSLLYGLFWMKRPDVLYAYHPPLTVGMTASLLRLFRRIPVVYDIQDMWPDTLRATGMMNNEKVLSVIEKVCRWVYRRVDHLVVLSPGFKRLLIERGVPEQKIEVIYNWCEEGGLNAPVGGCPPGFPDASRFRIVFAGNMGKAQALGAVIDAASILAASRPEICFVFVGAGVELDNLKREVANRSLANVVFIPRVPMNEVGVILAAADALLVHLKNDPLFAITIPSKTQAYLAIGRPILMAVPGDAAALVRGAGCGVTAEAENPRSIAAAAIVLADMPVEDRLSMGASSRDYYWKHLSLSVGAGHFADCFRRLVFR